MRHDDLESMLRPHRIEAPDNVDEYIEQGLTKARQVRSRAWIKRFGYFAAVVCILLGAIATSPNWSPILAEQAASLPFVQKLTQLSLENRTIEPADEEAYTQFIGQSVEHDGITFTVDKMIVDEVRVIVHYTVTYDPERYRKVTAENFNLYSVMLQGKIRDLLSWGSHEQLEDNNPVVIERGRTKGYKAFYFGTPVTKFEIEAFDIRTEMFIEPIEPGPTIATDPHWRMRVENDTNKVIPPVEVPLNGTVVVHGQTIHFKMKLHPSILHVEWEYDEANTHYIYGLDGLKLVDEDGTEWKQVKRWKGGGGLSQEQEMEQYYEIGDLSKLRSLTLKGEALWALDKADAEIVIDLDNQQLLKSPTDKIRLDYIKRRLEYGDYELQLSMEIEPGIDKAVELLHMVDASGRVINLSGTGEYKLPMTEIYFTTGDSEIESPARLLIYDYRYNKIKELFEMKVLP